MIRPYAVYWMDPVGATDDREIEPIPIVSVGFVVDQDDERIRIAGENHPDGGGRDFTVIPRRLIFAIKPLPRVYEPAKVFDEAKRRARRAA